jgi:hypothetical protein
MKQFVEALRLHTQCNPEVRAALALVEALRKKERLEKFPGEWEAGELYMGSRMYTRRFLAPSMYNEDSRSHSAQLYAEPRNDFEKISVSETEEALWATPPSEVEKARLRADEFLQKWRNLGSKSRNPNGWEEVVIFHPDRPWHWGKVALVLQEGVRSDVGTNVVWNISKDDPWRVQLEAQTRCTE